MLVRTLRHILADALTQPICVGLFFFLSLSFLCPLSPVMSRFYFILFILFCHPSSVHSFCVLAVCHFLTCQHPRHNTTAQQHDCCLFIQSSDQPSFPHCCNTPSVKGGEASISPTSSHDKTLCFRLQEPGDDLLPSDLISL